MFSRPVTRPSARGIHRIAQLGVKNIIGVPGDMNLELLDYIDEINEMSWGMPSMSLNLLNSS